METTNEKNSNKLTDLLNLTASLNVNQSDNFQYNYAKIVKNLKLVNKLLNLKLSEEQIKDIQNNSDNFCNEKTKVNLAKNEFYAKIKKNIRNNKRDICAKLTKLNKVTEIKEIESYL